MIMRCDLASRTLIASMAILAIASLVILAPPASADKPVVPDEPTVTDYTIYGFVYNVSDQVNIPMENVKVQLLDAEKSIVFVTYTDANGRFEFTYTEGQGKYLAFEYTGYTVRSLPDSMELYAEDMFSFDLTGIEPDQDGKYALTTADDAYHTIGMRATNGILFGYVKGIKGSNTFDIENAEVTVVSDTGQSYKTSTNSDGYFEMKDIPYGTYTVRASCNGFGTSEPVQASTADTTGIVISLVENEFGIGILGGLDAPHAMMVIGILIIGAIILLTLIAVHRSRTPGSDIVIVNDMEELEEEEGLNRP